MKILITGGTGFIGTPLVKKLYDDGHTLMLVVRRKPKNAIPGVTYLITHISNLKKYVDYIKGFDPEVAIHLAWEGIPDYSYEMGLKNLKYGITFINTIAQTKCQRVLITGSCWEYLNNTIGKLSEESVLDYGHPFPGAKNSLHEYATNVLSKTKINLIWARIFFAYGPGQRKDSIIPTCLKNIKDNKPTEVKSPEAKHDFIYIDDVVDALICLSQYCYTNATYNIGTGYPISVKEVVDLTYSLCGKTNNVVYSNEGTNTCYFADISKIKYTHGWSPKINIKEGIRRTIK
jgi:UDP-glucose 4-epimerase